VCSNVSRHSQNKQQCIPVNRINKLVSVTVTDFVLCKVRTECTQCYELCFQRSNIRHSFKRLRTQELIYLQYLLFALNV